MLDKKRRIHIGLFWRILPLTLLVGLLPLLLLAFATFQGADVANDRATDATSQALDDKSLEALEIQATQIANKIENFLFAVVQDTIEIKQLPRNPQIYLTFQKEHTRGISYATGADNAPKINNETILLYREVTYVDRNGLEKVLVRDGQVVPEAQLRDVSNPANTTYRAEDYFAQTKALPNGQVYVSHVTAWHYSLPALQPAAIAVPTGTSLSEYFGKYEAVIRFATPVFDDNNQFDGIVMLSLDHRHIMDFLNHALPGDPLKTVPWPAYVSGNYIYAWDDEGYLIVHPVLSRLRGLGSDGNLVGTWPNGRPTNAEREQLLFKMQIGDPPAPKIYQATLQNQIGNEFNTSQAGTLKANVYAAIRFDKGVYSKTGIFGGLAISANVADFHKAANEVRRSLDTAQTQLGNQTVWIVLGAVALLIVAGGVVAFNITSPVFRLTRAARTLEQGNTDYTTLNRMLNRRTTDEVTKLAQVFKQMSERVVERESELKVSNEKLEEINNNLETLVTKRTSDLANANQEINELNSRLKAENTRMRSELEITRQLQQMILPKEQELREVNGLEISSFMLPAEEVGGDYYDVLQDKGRVKIGIGDVTGHGLESGVVMIMVQSAVRTLLANDELDPSRYLSAVNKTIYENVRRMSTDKNLTLSLLDYDKGHLRLSGQHEETIIVRNDGSLQLIDTMFLGFPIGLEEDIAPFVSEVNLQLNPGDSVILYTDGIPEAENAAGEQYGMERFYHVIKSNYTLSAAELKMAIIENLLDFIGGHKVYDDITLLVLKQKEMTDYAQEISQN